MIELFKTEVEDRLGRGTYSVRLLQQFGQGDGYLDAAKVGELWRIASRHEVLFSDFTAGKIEPFLQILFDPSSIWLEIFREGSGPVGVAYLNHIIPRFDALGHFAVWDGVASGREEIFWLIAEWMFSNFELRRISCEIPPYQSGVIRFTKRLGFKQEGVKREAVVHRGRWFPLLLFGMTLEDWLTATGERNGKHTVRRGEEHHPDRDSGRNDAASEAVPELDEAERRRD